MKKEVILNIYFLFILKIPDNVAVRIGFVIIGAIPI